MKQANISWCVLYSYTEEVNPWKRMVYMIWVSKLAHHRYREYRCGVKIMFGTKPLPKPILTYCQSSNKHQWNLNWNAKWRLFCSRPNVLNQLWTRDVRESDNVLWKPQFRQVTTATTDDYMWNRIAGQDSRYHTLHFRNVAWFPQPFWMTLRD